MERTVNEVELRERLERLTKQVVKGAGIAFVGQIVGRLLTVLLQILLTRVLGTAGYGLYALGKSVLGIAEPISTLGLQHGIVRFGAMYYGTGDKARLKGILLLSLAISFGSAWVTALILYLCAGVLAERVFREPGLIGPLRIFAFALPFYTLMTMTVFSARALRRIDCDVVVNQLSRPMFTLLATGASFLLGYRLMGAVAGFLTSTVVSAGLGLYLVCRLFPELISRLKAIYEAKTLLGYSLTVLLVGMSNLLITKTDRIMLGILSSAEEVGIYDAAATLAIQVALFLISFEAIFAPTIADLFHQSRMEELQALFKATTKWIFTLTFPMGLAFILFARPLMAIFGPGFSAGAPVLISLAGAQLINSSTGPARFILTMTGRQRFELTNSLAMGGLNVVLNYLLIPNYGGLGAGIASGLSFTLAALARLLEVYWLYGMHPYRLSYWKPLMAGLVVALAWLGMRPVLKLTGWLWVGGVVLFGAMYIVLFWMLGLDDEERLILRAMQKRISRRFPRS